MFRPGFLKDELLPKNDGTRRWKTHSTVITLSMKIPYKDLLLVLPPDNLASKDSFIACVLGNLLKQVILLCL